MAYYPNLRQERKLQRQGFKYIAGLDESGRGAWAGPIVAAAVILDPKIKIKGLKDSKLLRAPNREEFFDKIANVAIAWSVAAINQQTIDKIGIQEANILAMKQALKKLSPGADYSLTDALSLSYRQLPNLAFIKGDRKITSIAAASIIAKVMRDQMMDKLDEQYPQYGFKQHKGYGTAHHFQMLAEHGICEIHRKTWQPMKYFIKG
jgi:ribonuclease HII